MHNKAPSQFPKTHTESNIIIDFAERENIIQNTWAMFPQDVRVNAHRLDKDQYRTMIDVPLTSVHSVWEIFDQVGCINITKTHGVNHNLDRLLDIHSFSEEKVI